MSASRGIRRYAAKLTARFRGQSSASTVPETAFGMRLRCFCSICKRLQFWEILAEFLASVFRLLRPSETTFGGAQPIDGCARPPSPGGNAPKTAYLLIYQRKPHGGPCSPVHPFPELTSLGFPIKAPSFSLPVSGAFCICQRLQTNCDYIIACVFAFVKRFILFFAVYFCLFGQNVLQVFCPV